MHPCSSSSRTHRDMQAILLLLATSSVSIATALPIAFPKGGGGKPGGGGGSTSSTSGKPGKPSSPNHLHPNLLLPTNHRRPHATSCSCCSPVSPPSSSSGRGAPSSTLPTVPASSQAVPLLESSLAASSLSSS
ncbi:hypothetical protein BC829DRAFT_214869 [Chytridium lagenaria]|nr:hypothetical protein BC829DRAFT_214869 [Chytridium lagenaria]